MIKKTLEITFLVLFLALNGMADPISNLGFGENVQGVQLSIALSNNIVAVGSEFTVTAKIKNSSTNIIYLSESSPEMDFSVFLISSSGKIYQLTPPAIAFTRLIRTELKPNKSRDWIIHVGVNKYFEPPAPVAVEQNIESGDYMLKANRRFSINGVFFGLRSNLLEVQIK